MNQSGLAVLDLIDNYGLILEDMLIVLDDMDLPFGKLRIKRGGSSGGHNGLASVIYYLNSEEIPRLRIGIERPSNSNEFDWVLSPFKEEEKEKLPEIINNAIDAIEMWVDEDIEVVMSKVN
jgi:PTH1 family peptidyl-tRNA hydrolase